MRTIPLTKGYAALIDDLDFELVSQFKWHFADGYAMRSGYPKIRMHRFILNAPNGLYVDHIDRNGLNNQRSNLRLCSHAQNLANRRKLPGANRYRGVWFSKIAKVNPWHAYIKHDGKRIYIGSFPSEIEAAYAWDETAIRLRGEFTALNFPKKKSA